jgi:hypothetical protein
MHYRAPDTCRILFRTELPRFLRKTQSTVSDTLTAYPNTIPESVEVDQLVFCLNIYIIVNLQLEQFLLLFFPDSKRAPG